MNGGSQHGTIPYGSFQSNFTKIDIGDSLGPWLYDGVTDSWEEARTFPEEWSRKNHMQVAWDGSTDQMIGLYGNNLTLYSGHRNKVSYRTLPDALKLRSGYGIAADPVRGKVVLFGGSWNGAPGDLATSYDVKAKHDTWTYDVAADVWTDVTSAVAPPPGMPLLDMVKLPMIWHASSGRMILHQSPITAYNADFATWPDAEFWTFDTAESRWAKLPVTGQAPPMTGMMAYDSGRDEIVIFGGGRDGDSDRPNLSRELYVCKMQLDGPPRPTTPIALDLKVSAATVNLTWDVGAGAVDVYRAKGSGSPAVYEKVMSGVAGGSYTEPLDAEAHAYRVVDAGLTRASSASFSEPMRPTGMVASVESATSVKLSWTAAPDLTYRVHRARGGDLFNGVGTVLTTLAGGSFLDATDDLSDGVARFYWVTAVSAAGFESGASPYATSMPDRPESPVTTAMDGGKVHVEWKWTNGSTIAGFRVYHVNHHMNTLECTAAQADAWWHSFVPLSSVPTTATDIVFTPPPGEEALNHYFYVRAVNVLGQDGYFTDLSSATDFRFKTEPSVPDFTGPQATCN